MGGMKKLLVIFCFCFLSLIIIFPAWTQEQEKLDSYTIAKMKYETAMELYKAGEYEKSLELVNSYIEESEGKEGKKVHYPGRIKADIYVLKAMLFYVFREEGYREEIETLFQKAIKIHIDKEIGDASEIPPLLIEIFKKIKKEYLDQFSKETKRHIIGLVTTLIYTEKFEAGNFQPGFYYTFNISNSWSINTTVKLGIGSSFWNTWHFKLGGLFYSDSRVEKLVYGLGLYNIFSININEKTIRNSISLCGHGEFFFRQGFGLAADIEVMRFDINIRPGETEEIVREQRQIQLIFANFDLYFLFTL
ncbi:MAG: hypothetical protein JXB88_19510 [Spirochaetales bacterium]|nr:hypothetical protein [Spirochaetales bacterium]